MSDTADHLEREIETHRANVEDTLDKLRGRLSADQLVDDIGQYFGDCRPPGAREPIGAWPDRHWRGVASDGAEPDRSGTGRSPQGTR
jgi:hypothetical protein